MKEPVRVFLRQILDFNRALWHTHILEKPPRLVNPGWRRVFAASNSQNKKGGPWPGAPSPNSLANSGFVFSVSAVVRFPAYFAIWTRSLFGGAAIGIGCRVCGDLQLSRIPTCWTQLTVQRDAHPLCVEYSRWRISAV